jgi:hypothetical protein
MVIRSLANHTAGAATRLDARGPSHRGRPDDTGEDLRGARVGTFGPAPAVILGIILAVTEESAMTSSHEILASPHEAPAGPGQRQHWADNLRVLVIAVVVVWHTAQAYLGGSAWYYMAATRRGP